MEREPMDVAAWLRGLGLERYAQTFRDNDIDVEVLSRLSADDLVAIGVSSVGHRRRLLDAITALSTGPKPASETASVSESAPEQRAPEGERRQVAVLFADLSGYSALSNELDAEEVHALLGRFFESID